MHDFLSNKTAMSTLTCDIKDVMHLLSHRLFKVSTSNDKPLFTRFATITL